MWRSFGINFCCSSVEFILKIILAVAEYIEPKLVDGIKRTDSDRSHLTNFLGEFQK